MALITDVLVAELLSGLEPDRGNRYAPRSVQTKGKAAHEQWTTTCRCMATAFGFARGSPDRSTFLARCGLNSED